MVGLVCRVGRDQVRTYEGTYVRGYIRTYVHTYVSHFVKHYGLYVGLGTSSTPYEYCKEP